MATGGSMDAALAGTVLVVEDDPALAGLLETALHDELYRVAVLGVVHPDAVRTAVGRLAGCGRTAP